MKIKWFNTIDSTNSAMAASRESLSDCEVWAARTQSAGRGQKGNSWSSAPGENLTFSIYLEPVHIAAAAQFAISQAVALGVCGYLAGKGIRASVKWPNDIYVQDRKICGILIENTIGPKMMKSSIVGVGLNLNQTEFPSSVPNPVSVKTLTGNSYVIDTELEELLRCILNEYSNIGPQTGGEYLKRLYLKDTPHVFTIAASGERRRATIRNVASDGMLEVEFDGGGAGRFAFKEIVY